MKDQTSLTESCLLWVSYSWEILGPCTESWQKGIIYDSQDMEATEVSINRWMDKEDVVYGILLSRKKDEFLPFAATWVDLEGIMLSEVSQTEKDKYFMISLICEI